MELPYGFVASFYARSFSGFPYERSITIYPPTGWAAANGAIDTGGVGVLAETQGTRRNFSVTNVDARFEKNISLGRSKSFNIGVEIYNLLGNAYLSTGVNPAGTWRSSAPNSDQGAYTVDYNYGRVTGVSGVRTYKFNAKFMF
jgi:hypothetical protein